MLQIIPDCIYLPFVQSPVLSQLWPLYDNYRGYHGHPIDNLVTLQLAEGEVSYNPNALAWKDGGNQIDAIHNVGYKDITTKNNVITLCKDVEGNLTNNILAGIYAEDTASKINVNNGLQIQVENKRRDVLWLKRAVRPYETDEEE